MYEKKDSQHIELGPGGLILNVKANEKLLKEIGGTKPLSSSNLLKLADFFGAYKTGLQTSNLLEIVALKQIIYKPDIQKALITAGYTVHTLPLLDLPEWAEAEDYRLLNPNDGSNESGNEDNDPPDDGQSVQVAWVSYSGVGLLIGVFYYRANEDKQKKRYRVIGVSPNPDSLQTDTQGRTVRVRANKEANRVQNEQD